MRRHPPELIVFSPKPIVQLPQFVMPNHLRLSCSWILREESERSYAPNTPLSLPPEYPHYCCSL